MTPDLFGNATSRQDRLEFRPELLSKEVAFDSQEAREMLSKIADCTADFNAWIETPEGKAALAAKKEEYEPADMMDACAYCQSTTGPFVVHKGVICCRTCKPLSAKDRAALRRCDAAVQKHLARWNWEQDQLEAF